MPNYKTMYFNLAARVADAIDLLVKAQQDGEDAFLAETPQPPVLFPAGENAPENEADRDEPEE